MKKFIFYIVVIVLSFSFLNVKANTLSSINITASIDELGTMHVEEIWQMRTNKDTEIYKEEYNLGNINITNFQVRDEDRVYTEKSNWNINDSFENKKYKYGINYVSQGLELCWGISEYGNKTYTISYDLENAVFNTEDSQVLYLRLINDLDFPPENFNITISGPEYFQDTLDVWGYGYKGYAYVDNGKIYLSNEENTSLKNGEYVVLLVKFPLNTFNVDENNTYQEYQTFNDVLESAESGSFEYDYGETSSTFDKIFTVFTTLFTIFCILIPFVAIFKNTSKYKFGPAGKNIKLKEINAFRDIPCDKDLFRTFFICQAYGLNNKNTDFFGAILLKWLSEDKIKIIKSEDKKLFKTKEVISIDLTNFKSDNEIEEKLYNLLFKASKDGILEEKEFTKYSKNNYKSVFNWLDSAEKYGRDFYIENGLVKKTKGKYLIDDKLKEEAVQVAGLKKYLKEFSRIETKQAIEVKLWKEYLMYAQIFGIAEEVAKQFKNLYPEVLTEMQSYNYDIGDIIIITHLSNTMMVSASSARSAAQSYNSGGGGFSSGGGGFGSFGGGGGGSR